MNMFIESDSSFYEHVALHRKRRIGKPLKSSSPFTPEPVFTKQKERERAREAELEAQREQEYEDYYYDNVNKSDSIFQLKGINVIDFTHKKAKFSFTPKEVIDLIGYRVVFYCSIRYVRGQWMIVRNTFPVNVQPRIYSRFLEPHVKIVKLTHLVGVIQQIYDILIAWCDAYRNFRREKYEMYLKNPDEVWLDSEDEELFLTEEEIRRRREKIERVWKRMLPPLQTRRKLRRVALN